jgi:alpha-beta hydrolase superfamily lysophospholipase
MHGGDVASMDIVRGETPISVRAALIEAPRENDQYVQTIYGAVSVDGALRRTLLTIPRAARGRVPAMLIVGGIGCYSIDDAAASNDPYMRLAFDLGRRGIAVMRVEKSGVGDSQGPACATVDFETELAGYNAAFAALRRDPRIDPARTFVFGHSIGAAGAPLLAAGHPNAGVIVAQGFGRPWVEYEMINTRRQLELSGNAPADVDAAMMVKAQCLHRLLVMSEPPEQVIADAPDCANLQVFPASQAYMHHLTTLNMAEIWAGLTSPALLIYGTSDFVTDEADHRRLTEIVNANHPGAATLIVLPGMDHYLAATESMASSLARVAAGNSLADYDPRFSATVADWICARARCG